MTQGSEQRRFQRSPVVIDARCRTPSRARELIELVDLSIEGCCVLTREPFLIEGQRVSVRPDGLEGLQAQVQWSKGVLAGLRFEKALYPPVYEHLRKLHARPAQVVDGQGYDSVSQELTPELRASLMRRIAARAEEEGEKREVDVLTAPYKRLPDPGRRPGLSRRQSDEKVLQLFLG